MSDYSPENQHESDNEASGSVALRDDLDIDVRSDASHSSYRSSNSDFGYGVPFDTSTYQGSETNGESSEDEVTREKEDGYESDSQPPFSFQQHSESNVRSSATSAPLTEDGMKGTILENIGTSSVTLATPNGHKQVPSISGGTNRSSIQQQNVTGRYWDEIPGVPPAAVASGTPIDRYRKDLPQKTANFYHAPHVTHQQAPNVYGAAAFQTQQSTAPVISSSNPNSRPSAVGLPLSHGENTEALAVHAAGGVRTRDPNQDKSRDSITASEAQQVLSIADAETPSKKGRDHKSTTNSFSTRDSQQGSRPIPIDQSPPQQSSQHHKSHEMAAYAAQTSTSTRSTANNQQKFIDPFAENSPPSPPLSPRQSSSPPSPQTLRLMNQKKKPQMAQSSTVIQGAPPPPEWRPPTLPAFIEYDMRMFVENPSPDFESAWNSQHVKFPCSKKNRCYSPSNVNSPLWKWDFIQKQLNLVSTVSGLEQAIRNYNPTFASDWSEFRNLRALVEYFPSFEKDTMKYIIQAALDMPKYFDRPIPLLRRQKNALVRLSQKQCVCLLANMFLCTFPRRIPRSSKLQNEMLEFPTVSFEELFSRIDLSCLEKLKCLVTYFEFHRKNQGVNQMVEIRRQVVPGDLVPKWSDCHARLSVCKVAPDVLLEQLKDAWQADFANKVIGGGVLGSGAVQEEIRFVISPECIVARLICQTLDGNEAVLISGSQQYSVYEGYGSTFKFKSALTELDGTAQVIAFDALSYYSGVDPMDQFKSNDTLRELTKAFAAFLPANEEERAIPIATGRWGCGVFKGNETWKFIIQWMAAAATGRPITFCTLNDRKLFNRLFHFVQCTSSVPKLTVVDIYRAMAQWRPSSATDDFLPFLALQLLEQSPKINDSKSPAVGPPASYSGLYHMGMTASQLPSQSIPHNPVNNQIWQQKTLGAPVQRPALPIEPQISQPVSHPVSQQPPPHQHMTFASLSIPPPQYHSGLLSNQGTQLQSHLAGAGAQGIPSNQLTSVPQNLGYPPNVHQAQMVQAPTNHNTSLGSIPVNSLKLSKTPVQPWTTPQ